MSLTVDTQLDRLKSQLLTSGVQQQNNALYQVVNQLIDAVKRGQTEIVTQVSAPASLVNETYLTVDAEVADLPNSRQLLAGTGVTFNDTVANARTVDVVGVIETANFTTASLGSGATGSGSFVIGASAWKTAQLIGLSSNRGGFLVIYASAAARDADTRVLPATTDPAAGIGIFMDASFSNGGSAIDVTPPVLLYNDDATPKTLYYRFYNGELTSGTTTITVTFVVSNGGGGSGGGSATHSFLSATHTDTTAASGVNGDLVIFNATWQRLPIGVAGRALISVAGLPAWSVDGTGLNISASNLTVGDLPLARIPNDLITFTKLQNISAASKLLGRGSAAGAGDIEEITLGAGLTMTGTTLSSSAGGDVVGPASATSGRIALFDGVTGKLIKDNGDATLTADLTVGDQLIVIGAGPHVIGSGSVNTSFQLYQTGNFTPGASTGGGWFLDPTLTADINFDIFTVSMRGTINEAASGTHGLFATIRILPPTIVAGAATLTNAASLYITGAPTGATNNYALWIAGGDTLTGGNITVTNTAPFIALIDSNGTATFHIRAGDNGTNTIGFYTSTGTELFYVENTGLTVITKGDLRIIGASPSYLTIRDSDEATSAAHLSAWGSGTGNITVLSSNSQINAAGGTVLDNITYANWHLWLDSRAAVDALRILRSPAGNASLVELMKLSSIGYLTITGTNAANVLAVQIQNTSSTGWSGLDVHNDTGHIGYVLSAGSTNTSGGVYPQNSLTVLCDGAGGLQLVARNGSGNVAVWTDGSPVLRASWAASGLFTTSYGMVLGQTISPAALASGNNNDWAPTGFATAFLIRATANAANSTITGIAGGVNGRIIIITNVGASGFIILPSEDANSSAANRFAYSHTLTTNQSIMYVYDGTSSRWRVLTP